MENQQMAMPAEMAPAGPNPDEMAIYEQMRQQISPQEFSNEMLASASQIDPQAVAEFTEELRSLDVSAEELDALNDLVDEILANPEQYEQLRQKYLAQGLPDDILPEQFDPNFFAAMNMAVDQMIAAPTGVQAFAEGGIAELKPIAKAIASYGRNGDTMLAHITPAEARMLRRRGGSGTINPHTGLPEFFLKKAFKSIGKAVKKFASSTVGRLVTTVALGFFLGPAAASVMGVGAGTAAGMAISGFVGGAGSTLLAGGNLKDALKAGAIGGLTAGVAQGLSGAPLTGPATMTPGQALQGRVDQFTGMFKPGAAVQAPTPGAGAGPQGIGPNQAAVPPAGGPQFDVGDPGAGFEPMGGGTKPSIFEQGKQLFNEKISPSGIRQAATPGAQQAAANAVAAAEKTIPATITGDARAAMLKSTYDTALKGAMPGIVGTYGPMAAVGLGTMAAFGGFDTKPVQGGDITKSLNTPVTQRIRDKGLQSQMYLQGLPGVVYDDKGAPVFGQSTRLPTYDVPDYNLGGFGSQGIMNLPTAYIPPRGYEGGGEVAAPPPAAAAPAAKTPEQLAAERRAATEAMMAQQKAGRDLAAQKRAQRLAAGSGQMYGNINAGLAALAPENFPGAPVRLDAAREAAMRQNFTGLTNDIDYARVMQQQGYRPEEVAALTGRTFGDINRRYSTALRQDAAAPMLQGQRDAMATQRRTLENARGIEFPGSQLPATQPPGTIGAPVTQPPVAQPPGTIGTPVTQPPVTQPPVTQPPVTQPPVTQPAITNTQITEYLAANPGMTDAQVRGAMDQFGVKVDQMAAATGLPVDQIQQRYDTASKFNNQDIQNYLAANPGMTDAQTRAAMDQFGVGTAQMAAATGLPFEQIQQRYNTASKFNNQDILNFLDANKGMDDRQIRAAMDQFGVGTAQMAAATGLPIDQVQQRYNTAGEQNLRAQQFNNEMLAGAQNLNRAAPVQPPVPQPPVSQRPTKSGGIPEMPSILDADVQNWFATNPGASDRDIRTAMDQYGVGTDQMARVTGLPFDQVQQRYNTAFMNMGGIAGLAQGGYPRRTGQISGPGTEKSDSIPAMLSDGEFVMTAKAVRGAGKGSRRAGAKQMYKLMHQLEKNSERG